MYSDAFTEYFYGHCWVSGVGPDAGHRARRYGGSGLAAGAGARGCVRLSEDGCQWLCVVFPVWRLCAATGSVLAL